MKRSNRLKREVATGQRLPLGSAGGRRLRPNTGTRQNGLVQRWIGALRAGVQRAFAPTPRDAEGARRASTMTELLGLAWPIAAGMLGETALGLVVVSRADETERRFLDEGEMALERFHRALQRQLVQPMLSPRDAPSIADRPADCETLMITGCSVAEVALRPHEIALAKQQDLLDLLEGTEAEPAFSTHAWPSVPRWPCNR